MRRPVTYFLPALIVLVAAFQFYNVYVNNLTRWKGGGFGMYSDTHPLKKQVWIGRKDSLHLSTYWIKSNPLLAKRAHQLKFHTSESYALKFAQFAAISLKQDSILVQIWEPLIDGKTNSLLRKKIREVRYVKGT